MQPELSSKIALPPISSTSADCCIWQDTTPSFALPYTTITIALLHIEPIIIVSTHMLLKHAFQAMHALH